MGNRFSRRRDGPANGAETPAAEEKAADEPVATQAEEASVSQEVQKAEQPATPIEEPVAAAVAEPVVESVPEAVAKAEPEPKLPEPEAPVASAPLVDLTPEPMAKVEAEVVEEPAPPTQPEPEPLVSISKVPEPVPEPVAELVPEPVAVPEPVPEPIAIPEPVPEPVAEPVLEPVAEPEAIPELLTQELLPEPALPEPLFSSDPLVDLAVPEITPQLLNASPSPALDHAHSPEPAYPDVPTELPGKEECLDSIEAAVNSVPVPEDPKESWESLEKPLEQESVGGAGNVEQLLFDINTDVGDSELLKHLDLTGNDLVNDLLANDIGIPDDIPIADGSPSNELM